LSAYGVSSVVGINGKPSLVPESVITDLQARVGSDGLVALADAPEFAVGQRLRIDHGPFSGRLCLYQGMLGAERVLVLLDCFGRSNQVTLDRTALVKA
jgi:transcriptional antiterminator RfaH